MDTSEVVANAAEAWRRYVSIGAISASLLRPHVAHSWVRSHDHGADPWAARAEGLAPGAVDRLLQRHTRLLVAARPYLQLLSEAAGCERHAIMLGTADAILLDVLGDEQTLTGPERVPGPGALLSEELCGSNGVGTPLVERRYVEIVSTEHFIHGFHPFTCHGVPIVSLAGRQEGVLSASVRRPEIARRLREILFCAAHGIASELARLELLERIADAVKPGARATAAAEALDQAVRRLGAAHPRTTRPRADGAPATAPLLRRADEVCRRLEHQQRAWHELATLDLTAAAPVALNEEVAELLLLLRPEAERRHVELVAGDGCFDPVAVLADRLLIRRAIFRALLHALDVAEGGGAIVLNVVPRPSDLACTLDVRCAPAPGSAHAWLGTSLALPMLRSAVSA